MWSRPKVFGCSEENGRMVTEGRIDACIYVWVRDSVSCIFWPFALPIYFLNKFQCICHVVSLIRSFVAISSMCVECSLAAFNVVHGDTFDCRVIFCVCTTTTLHSLRFYFCLDSRLSQLNVRSFDSIFSLSDSCAHTYYHIDIPQ